jgi:arylsulfatase A-like enzyme
MSAGAQRREPAHARGRSLRRARSFAQWLAPACLAIAASACGDGAASAPRPPNLILVTVDTLRADHTQVCGYARPTTPNLARLGAEGVRFANTIAQAPWTLPSMASLHTSLYPRQHGAIGGELALPAAAETLAERLQARGYHTIAVVSHSFVGSSHGFAQGFEIFDETNLQGHEAVTSAALTHTALERVANVGEPFFLWVHYFDPHFTYIRHPEYGFSTGYTGHLPPKISAKRLKETTVSSADLVYIQAIYDEEIALTDEWIGKLWAGLSARPGAEHDVLVVTADHGEYFQERGRFFHGKDVYQELVHVPLLIAGAIDPALRGALVTAAVETRSLPRTLLNLAGGDGAVFGGADLLEVARSGRAPPVFTEGSHAFGEDARKVAVVLDGWKLIHDLDQDRFELFALASDPSERDDRWPSDGDASRTSAPLPALERCLAEFAALPCLEPTPIGLDAKALEELQDLGYAR